MLDAKYKRLDKGVPESADVHEVLSYMYALNAKRGFLFYPWQQGEEIYESNVHEKRYELNGFGEGGRFVVIGMKYRSKRNVKTIEPFVRQ